MISVSYVILNSITRPKSMKCQWMSLILSEHLELYQLQLLWYCFTFYVLCFTWRPGRCGPQLARLWLDDAMTMGWQHWPGEHIDQVSPFEFKKNFFIHLKISALCTCPILLLPIKPPSKIHRQVKRSRSLRLNKFCHHWKLSEYTSQILRVSRGLFL